MRSLVLLLALMALGGCMNVSDMGEGVRYHMSDAGLLDHSDTRRTLSIRLQPDSFIFIGQGAFVPAVISGPQCVTLEVGEYCSLTPLAYQVGAQVDVLLRPDDVVHDDHSELTAVVKGKVFMGSEFMYTLQLPSGQQVLAQVPSHHNHAIGEAIGIRLELDHLIAFAR